MSAGFTALPALSRQSSLAISFIRPFRSAVKNVAPRRCILIADVHLSRTSALWTDPYVVRIAYDGLRSSVRRQTLNQCDRPNVNRAITIQRAERLSRYR